MQVARGMPLSSVLAALQPDSPTAATLVYEPGEADLRASRTYPLDDVPRALVLACAGLGGNLRAQPPSPASAAVRSHQIPAGSLEDTLRFGRDTGLLLSLTQDQVRGLRELFLQLQAAAPADGRARTGQFAASRQRPQL